MLMHRKLFLKTLATFTGLNFHTLELITANLNKAGITSSTGRGRHAPGVTVGEVAIILLAVTGEKKAKEATQTFKGLRSLKTKRKKVTLEKRLKDIISKPSEADKVDSFRVYRGTGSLMACIHWRGGEDEIFMPKGIKKLPCLRIEAILDGSVISSISHMLKEV